MKKKAFSIAEAFITLAIIGIAMGASAPLISKAIKGTSVEASSKWFFTRNAANITRPAGNVGIGVSMNADPLAKLEIKNGDDNKEGLRVNNPNGIRQNLFNVLKGNTSLFNINSSGRTAINQGLTLSLPTTTGNLTSCETNPADCPLKINVGGTQRLTVRNYGGIHLRPFGGGTPLLVQDEEGKNQMSFADNKYFGFNRRALGNGQETYRFHFTDVGRMVIYPPMRSELIDTSKDEYPRNDARAISIRYPQDSDPSIDCCNSDSVGDGYTETAFFTSNGSLYINSVNLRSQNDWAGHAIEVRTGITPRAFINTDGQLVLRPKSTAKGDYALIIGKSLEEENNSTNAWIKKDGTAWFKGNVSVDGTIANADLDTKLAKVNKELTETKEVIALLKQQNELMQEKIVALETTLAAFQVQNHIAKNSENKLLGILK